MNGFWATDMTMRFMETFFLAGGGGGGGMAKHRPSAK